MQQQAEDRATWTRDAVEARLVVVFALMPCCPVYSWDGRLRAASTGEVNDLTAVLGWATILDGDRVARKVLFAWARCRATRASFGELCREMGWPRATAEAARRRGADAIVARLNRSSDLFGRTIVSNRLDSKKAGGGASAD